MLLSSPLLLFLPHRILRGMCRQGTSSIRFDMSTASRRQKWQETNKSQSESEPVQAKTFTSQAGNFDAILWYPEVQTNQRWCTVASVVWHERGARIGALLTSKSRCPDVVNKDQDVFFFKPTRRHDKNMTTWIMKVCYCRSGLPP